MQFKTESGTIYEINKDLMAWTRLKREEASGQTRGESGNLVRWPEIRIGERAKLFDDDIKPGHAAHCVLTSPVVEIME